MPTPVYPENLTTLLADLNDSAVVSATGAHWENNDAQPWQKLEQRHSQHGHRHLCAFAYR
ncbi:MAG: hypothetical protein R3E31_11415 [Chloroflexota bacterium]